MIKINYPKTRKSFEQNYLDAIVTKEMKIDFKKYLKDDIFIECDIKCLNDLLLAPFDDLLKIYEKYRDKCPPVSKEEDYKIFFNYDSIQPGIAKFFMDNSEELNLKTCYFCNIDYINVFDDRANTVIYKNILEVLNSENKDDLMKLDGIHENLSKKIISYTKEFRKKEDLEAITGIGKLTRKKIFKSDIKRINSTNKNHFTLDHFLPKRNCPLLALSLYNFVPSCYACNSKFKKEDELLKTHLSPTSKNFSVDKDMKFKLYFTKKIEEDEFDLHIDADKKIEEYINTFKLQGRYAFHKDKAIELVTKQQNYCESRLSEIADILKISPEQVKKDIFGKELFEGDVQNHSFTKLKRDIACNIGIKGVKNKYDKTK